MRTSRRIEINILILYSEQIIGVKRIGTKKRTVSLFFLLRKEWMASVRYKRVERTKIRQEAEGRKVEI